MTASTPKRLLLISYPFPPVGGAGVQRTVKFVKYLPDFGWKPTVLTVANPSVPVLDKSLEADVPPDTVVRRARTMEPGYALKAAVSGGGANAKRAGEVKVALKSMARGLINFVLQPDAQVLWIPGAVKEGLTALRETKHDAIMVTGPPFSSFLAAATLAKQTGLPLVLDYRDEWGISNAYLENRRPDPISQSIQAGMQRRVVRRAQALIATTKASAEAIDRVRAEAKSSAKVATIYNGFDPDDFSADWPSRPDDLERDGRYRLAYVGTLWKLTDVSPLVDAVLDLANRRPDLAARLELAFAGRRTGEQDALLARLQDTPVRLILHPYLDHSGAVDLVRSSDGLIILLADVPGAGRVVPAKVFESMAAERTVLAIAPSGEARDLLVDHPSRGLFAPAEITAVADFLAREIERKARDESISFAGYDPSRFDRRHEAGTLASLLDELSDGNYPL